MSYQSVPVRMLDGTVRMAEITSQTKNGYRTARVGTSYGGKIRGRVTARHGFTDGRVLPFEVLADDAAYAGRGKVFVTAA